MLGSVVVVEESVLVELKGLDSDGDHPFCPTTPHPTAHDASAPTPPHLGLTPQLGPLYPIPLQAVPARPTTTHPALQERSF